MAISRQAFEDRLVPLLGSLQGVSRRLTCDEAEGEDLVAEAVARAWQARESLDDPEAFRAWIFRILHNTFVSEWRRKRAGPQCDALQADEAEEESEPAFSIFEQLHQPFLLWFSNPEREFVEKLLREDLEAALARLPEAHRVVVLLSDLEGFTYGEIAAALDIPVGTVRSRLARARGSLQKALWRQAQEYGLRTAAAGGAGEPARARMDGNHLASEETHTHG
jgi:RNA polymerase sigma factor (sigma-70 family)